MTLTGFTPSVVFNQSNGTQISQEGNFLELNYRHTSSSRKARFYSERSSISGGIVLGASASISAHRSFISGNIQLQGSSSMYAEDSSFSGSMNRSIGYLALNKPNSKPYMLYRDCQFVPSKAAYFITSDTVAVRWAKEISEVYACLNFSIHASQTLKQIHRCQLRNRCPHPPPEGQILRKDLSQWTIRLSRDTCLSASAGQSRSFLTGDTDAFVVNSDIQCITLLCIRR